MCIQERIAFDGTKWYIVESEKCFDISTIYGFGTVKNVPRSPSGGKAVAWPCDTEVDLRAIATCAL